MNRDPHAVERSEVSKSARYDPSEEDRDPPKCLFFGPDGSLRTTQFYNKRHKYSGNRDSPKKINPSGLKREPRFFLEKNVKQASVNDSRNTGRKRQSHVSERPKKSQGNAGVHDHRNRANENGGARVLKGIKPGRQNLDQHKRRQTDRKSNKAFRRHLYVIGGEDSVLKEC